MKRVVIIGGGAHSAGLAVLQALRLASEQKEAVCIDCRVPEQALVYRKPLKIEPLEITPDPLHFKDGKQLRRERRKKARKKITRPYILTNWKRVSAKSNTMKEKNLFYFYAVNVFYL